MDNKEEEIFKISKKIMNDKFSLFDEKEKENIARLIRSKKI
jgi:hypothetical protein